MAECIILKGGGGADLDAVTAGKTDVLAGKVIVDKEGEPITGTMPNIGPEDEYKWIGHDGSQLYLGMSHGAHITDSDVGYPRVRVPWTRVAEMGGLVPGKMLSGQSACGVDGNIPVYNGNYWNANLGVGLESDNLYSFAPYGYHAPFDDRGTLHRIPIQRVRDVTGVSANKIIEGQNIAGVWGSVKDYSYLANGQTAF